MVMTLQKDIYISIENLKSKIKNLKMWPLGEWLLVGAATPLLFFPGRWSIAGILLIALAWVVRKRAIAQWRLATPADPAIALMLFMAIVGVMVSVDRALSLNRATVLLLGWLLYESIVVTVAKVGLNKRLFVLFGLLGSLLGVMGLTMTDWAAGILVPIPGLYDHLPQLNLNLPGSGVPHSGGLFNPRTVAGGATLLWPINGMLAVSGTGLPRWQRLIHAFTALLLIGLIFLTQSPQGVLAFAAVLFVFIVLWAEKLAQRGLIAITLAIGLIVIWVLIAYPGSLLDFLAERAGFGLVARFELWVRAARMFATAPLTGIGLNNYSTMMDALYPGYALGPEAHAHNLFLQTLTDLGILGLFGLLLFLGVVISVTIAVIRAEQDKIIRSILIAIIATIAGWLTYCLLEVLSLGHKPGVFLWAILALPMAFAQRTNRLGASKRLWRFSAIFSIFTLIMIWQTGYLSLNMATITAQQALFDHESKETDIETARDWLERAEKQVGQQAHLSRLRALLYLKAEEPDAAAHAFRELAALELTKPLWWWAPAPAPSALRGLCLSNGSQQAARLASIYNNWYIRFPDRAEPVALLAYTYADGMLDSPCAIDFIERALQDGNVEPNVLQSILANLKRN